MRVVGGYFEVIKPEVPKYSKNGWSKLRRSHLKSPHLTLPSNLTSVEHSGLNWGFSQIFFKQFLHSGIAFASVSPQSRRMTNLPFKRASNNHQLTIRNVLEPESVVGNVGVGHEVGVQVGGWTT